MNAKIKEGINEVFSAFNKKIWDAYRTNMYEPHEVLQEVKDTLEDKMQDIIVELNDNLEKDANSRINNVGKTYVQQIRTLSEKCEQLEQQQLNQSLTMIEDAVQARLNHERQLHKDEISRLNKQIADLGEQVSTMVDSEQELEQRNGSLRIALDQQSIELQDLRNQRSTNHESTSEIEFLRQAVLMAITNNNK